MTDYNIAYSELTDTYYITQNGEKVSDCTNQIQSIAEAEHKAMCESCIHKVSADDIKAIRNSAIDECIAIVNFHKNEYDGICWAIRELEELKEKNN